MLLEALAAAAIANSGVDSMRLARLREREEEYTQGFLHKDRRQLAGVFAEDFYDTSPTAEVVRRAEFLSSLDDPSWRVSSVRVSDATYLLHGDSAVVAARFEITGEEKGKPFRSVGRATDVWVWQGGDWRCVAAHSSLEPQQH